MGINEHTPRGYVNAKIAAAYCNYGESTFRAFVEQWKIPRYGPKRNRYKITDLDKFMANPSCFMFGTHTTRHKNGFTPVAI